MAKELLIMRHAKSSWKDNSVADHDRPLNKRGSNDAPRMADFLRSRNLVPDLILSSSANRAKSTAKLILDRLGISDLELEIVDDFYLGAPDVYIETLQRLPREFERPMVVGHNPGLEQLVARYSESLEFMSTAAIAHIEYSIDDWSQLNDDRNGARMAAIFRPKEIEWR